MVQQSTDPNPCRFSPQGWSPGVWGRYSSYAARLNLASGQSWHRQLQSIVMVFCSVGSIAATSGVTSVLAQTVESPSNGDSSSKVFGGKNNITPIDGPGIS